MIQRNAGQAKGLTRGPRATPLGTAAMAATGPAGSSVVYAYQDAEIDRGFELGFGETPELSRRSVSIDGELSIEANAPAEAARFSVAPALTGGSKEEGVLDPDTAVRLFVQGLIQRREVQPTTTSREMAYLGAKPSERQTHAVVSEKGKLVLKRNHFSCGCNRHHMDCC